MAYSFRGNARTRGLLKDSRPFEIESGEGAGYEAMLGTGSVCQ